MSGISTAIEVQDRVSGSLNRITAALYNTTSAFYGVDSASDTAFNSSGVQAMTQELYTYEARIQEIESELIQARNRLEQMENQTKENTDAARKLEGTFGSLGGIIAGLGLGMLVKQQVGSAIEYASDLTEVQNVVDVVFGDASKTVDAWAKTTLDAFGINELTAKQFAGTMGAMLSSSGLEGQAQEMSMSLAELAGDMASFYNLDAEEAFTKIRSGISGETEPLKQLGINMSVANMEAYALSQGIKKPYDEMSQAEQTLLRYNYLLSATANAQGDFANTSDSYSNQVKLLKENWTAFTGELASSALPMLASAVSMLNSAISFISEHWNIIGPILAGFTAAIAVYAAFTLATKAATVAQAIFNAVQNANPVMLVVMAIMALIGILIALCNWIAETTGIASTGIGVIMGALATAGAFIYNLFLGLVDLVLGIVNYWYNIFGSFVNFFGNVFNDPIGSIIQLFGSLADNVLGVVETIARALDKVFGSSMADTVSGWRASLSSKVEIATKEYGNGTYEKVMDELELSSASLGLERLSYGDAFSAGAAWGDSIAEKLSGSDTSDIDSAYTTTDSGSVADSLSTIAGDTSDIKDSVDISDENLKYLRDVAERDVINRFTTAEIKVDMNNTNNIASNMDIDGIVEQLTMGVQEAMEQAAEGVHV